MEHTPYEPEDSLRHQHFSALVQQVALETELGMVRTLVAALELLLDAAAQEGPE
jgi:hypothetical protein